MPQILVVDGSTASCEPIVSALRAAGYQTVTAATAPEALKKLRTLTPRVIVLDVSNPGISGFIVLAAIRANSTIATPRVILMTSTPERGHVLRAAKLGVRDYLIKSGTVAAEVVARVKKYVPSEELAPERQSKFIGDSSGASEPAAPAAMQALTGANLRQRTLRRIEQAEIKTLPGAVSELLNLTLSPRGTVAEAARCLKRDPVLSARLLRVSNSAAFASNRARIATVDDAVRHVGLSAVRNLATSMQVLDTVLGKNSGDDILRCWQHCLAVALIMEKLAGIVEEPAGLAYMVGLCHDLPGILFAQHLPEEAAQAAELSRTTDSSRPQIFAEVCGLSYGELKGALLDRLSLPSLVTAPIREYMKGNPKKPLSDAATPLCRLLAVSDLYAHGLLLAPLPDAPIRTIGLGECPGIENAHTLMADPETVRSEVLIAAGASGLSTEDVNRAAQLPVPPQPVSVQYIRDNSCPQFDPVETMLRLIARETVVHAASPPPKFQPDSRTLVILASAATSRNDVMRALAAQYSRQFTSSSSVVHLSDNPSPGAESDTFRTMSLPISGAQLGDLFGLRAVSARRAA